jgi:ABC-type bacteriocin/lantibiotic exporter with double-glycine peptidase domain
MSRKEKPKYGLNWISAKTKGTRFHIVLYTILILVSTAVGLSMAYFLKLFVDIATGELDASLLAIGGIAVAVVAVGGLIAMLASVLSKYIYGRTERELRTELLGVIFSRRMLDISKQHTGELHTKLTADIQAVSMCFPLIIENMIGGIASAVFATAAIFFLNWKMALVMLILMPVLMLVMGLITPFMQKASVADKQNDEANRSIMQEYLSRIILIKAYFMQKKTLLKIKDTYAKKLKSGMKLGMWEGLAAFSGMRVSMAMFMAARGLGAYFVLQGETTVGSLIAIVQLLNYIVMPLEKFAGTISQVSQAVASSGRIGEIYELPADSEIPHREPVDASMLTAENISFAYNNEDKNILDNLSVSFEKGAVTGIVGKSGCGKSTLLKLLIGLYEPKQGEITLKTSDGANAEITPQIAYVPPNDYLFSGTVAENIIMSEDNPRIDEMKAACSDANILGFIESLSGGFDTSIGESGGTVSSGQAQRFVKNHNRRFFIYRSCYR